MSELDDKDLFNLKEIARARGCEMTVLQQMTTINVPTRSNIKMWTDLELRFSNGHNLSFQVPDEITPEGLASTFHYIAESIKQEIEAGNLQ